MGRQQVSGHRKNASTGAGAAKGPRPIVVDTSRFPNDFMLRMTRLKTAALNRSQFATGFQKRRGFDFTADLSGKS